jgi:maltose/moltooligosaccharide transporter
MQPKKSLTFWQMWNLSFGFFGVQIAYALQSANISRIFATLGADPHQLSFFWILPPLMGMIVQPLIGKYSDRTWCRMGRRKPYLLVGAVVAVLVMILLPNAGNLIFSSRLLLGLNGAMWFGLFSLIFLDTSINVAMQPFKMMVGDMVDEEQKATAYSIQSLLCNAGSLVGYLFPIFFTWIGIANTAPKGVIPHSVVWSFYCGAAILILCVLYTFAKVKEMPPAEYAAFHGIDPQKQAADAQAVAGMLAHWERSLVQIGFLDPDAPKKLMPRLQQLFNRAQPTHEEIHILRGIAKAMADGKTPPPPRPDSAA